MAVRSGGTVTLAAVAALWIYTLVHPLLPRFEGVLFPVLTNFTVTSQELAPNQLSTKIYGTFNRNRDCTWLRTEWFIGTDHNGALVPVEYVPGVKDREIGFYDFGPWIVHMTPSQFKKSEGIVTHRCHPFWVTQTTFWESGK